MPDNDKKPQSNREITTLEDFLKKIPDDKREGVIAALESSATIYSGMLPPAEEYAKYEKAHAGTTDFLIRIAEAQISHRIESEKTIIRENFSQVKRGQYIAAALVALLTIVALTLALSDHDDVAKSIVLTTIIAVTVIYVLGKVPHFTFGESNESQ